MSDTMSTLDPTVLFEASEMALAIAELPQFKSADEPEQIEVLSFLPASDDNGEASWALVLRDGPSDEYIAIDAEMADQLLRAHFREWLLSRGWQAQVHCYADRRRWTLVDCLSAADGGGDRLDVDYPYGEDELTVLADSVLAVNTIH